MMNKTGRIVKKALFWGFLLVSLNASAENAALLQLLKALYDNGTINDSTYKLVKRVAETDDRQSPSEVSQIKRQAAEQTVTQIVDQKIESIKSAINAEKPGIRVGGRIQTDAATYAEDGRRHNDGTELRRVRLFAQGELSRNWRFKLQYDFTGTGINGIQDAYLDYKGFDWVSVRLGHFKEPFGLSNSTSSKYVTFTERSLANVFSTGRNIGIRGSRSGKNWSLAAGIYGEGRDGAARDNDEGIGITARGSYAHIHEKKHVLHLGASVSYRYTGSNDNLRFRERPESHITNTRIVDTGIFDADDYTRLILESAYVNGSFHLQGEYYYTTVNRDMATNPDLDFDGFYIEGSWFLTGESLNYKGSGGNFSRVSPKSIVGEGGIGAWQIAARFSNVDLTDGDINGGTVDSITFGLNWFPTSQLRFSANYVSILDLIGGPAAGDEPDAFQVRAQLEF